VVTALIVVLAVLACLVAMALFPLYSIAASLRPSSLHLSGVRTQISRIANNHAALTKAVTNGPDTSKTHDRS